MSKFSKLVKEVEKLDEQDSRDHGENRISIWYGDGRQSWKITYQDGKPVAIQKVGTLLVHYK